MAVVLAKALFRNSWLCSAVALSATATAFSFDTVRTSSADHSVMMWHLNEDKRALRFAGHTGDVYGVRFAPSGNLLASASQDCTVRFWFINRKDESEVLRAHTAAVRSLDFSPNSLSLATASDDMTVKAVVAISKLSSVLGPELEALAVTKAKGIQVGRTSCIDAGSTRAGHIPGLVLPGKDL
ncbi:hypothetical protein HPB50_020095 [Hyalomma asiaticum]|uniref:Uncharacterized protein n=1 Tax=Hyalomma asiaticum TaxID=266040 RepID=A0ACB7RPR7_HYAAI|nr:hypothetical protein HPB50_020095 [Hyalomma asiaticum]